VGVYGGVDTSQHRRHFSSGSSSPPLSVRSSGRPEVTSSRDVTRRSTTVSMSHSQRRRRERRRRRLCPSLAQLSLGWCTSNRSAHAISSCSAALKRTACVSERTHSQSAMSAASVCTSEAYTAMRVEHPPLDSSPAFPSHFYAMVDLSSSIKSPRQIYPSKWLLCCIITIFNPFLRTSQFTIECNRSLQHQNSVMQSEHK